MSSEPSAAGIAALSICESMLLSLTETGLVDEPEAQAILTDAATAHREAALLADGAGAKHGDAAAIIELIRDHGNSVRRTRPSPALDGDGAADPDPS